MKTSTLSSCEMCCVVLVDVLSNWCLLFIRVYFLLFACIMTSTVCFSCFTSHFLVYFSSSFCLFVLRFCKKLIGRITDIDYFVSISLLQNTILSILESMDIVHKCKLVIFCMFQSGIYCGFCSS